ncbi:MAG: hypothetical protein ACP5QG_07845 [candidate division WOR-3 bacterium]
MLWKDDVLTLSILDYDRATEDFLRVARNTPGIIGVWQNGSISAPGISDLDFLLVVSEGVKVSWKRMRENLSPEASRILIHSPIAITESLLPWLGYVNDMRGYHRLDGPAVSFAEPENKALINLLVSTRLTMAKLMGLARTAFLGRSGVRSFLCRVHGIRHNFTLMERRVPPMLEEAAELRKSWLSLGQEKYQRLDNLLARAQDACVEFLRGLTIPWPLESGPDEFIAENWRFYGGNDCREKNGMFSWLPRKARLGEVAYYSTWFELGITPGLSGLLAGTLAPTETTVGRKDWEKYLEVLALSEKVRDRLPEFSPAAPLLSLQGWRSWVP